MGKGGRSSGRGGGWTQQAEDRFIETLAESTNVTRSAAEAGVSLSSAYRRRARDASFRARWGEALATGYAQLEMAMLERALHGRPKEVKVGGESRIIQDYDDRIALALLKMHRDTVREIEASRFPAIDRITAALGGSVRVEPVPVPLHCADGFNEAYYGRPEALLDAEARLACSSWSLVPQAAVERFVRALSDDLASGRWDEKFGHLRTQPFFDGPLRLVIGQPASG